MSSLTVVLKRVDRIYRPGDMVEGVVVVESGSPVSHQGINLTCTGMVTMQLSAKSVGLFESFYNSLKPQTLLNVEIEVAKAGKLPKGRTELPFAFELTPAEGAQLYETYHGVFINISYSCECVLARKALSRNLSHKVEWLVQGEGVPMPDPSPIPFKITPDTLENVKKRDRGSVPEFCITGSIDSSVMSLTRPLTGDIVVEKCSVPIQSVELQLVRVETCGCADGFAKEATEVQNIQIGDGNVCRGLAIPLVMIFPRLFSCPTVASRNFKIEFEINLVVLLEGGYLVTENFPIRLIRAKDDPNGGVIA
ncbi:down syndrome critical region protein 3 [Thecamonas trahens ATCC 50062]|uniref:Vacuolar protein sorting-associated protein 26C n=1 Tax=Thecamonas trahens ATCC 50062 TaxID=461836 RepID=A0A0L0D5S2_THETB|nr:down syndrome critical region protein 3 [Thecamonas trahens ATCC 50062]KNC47436.1 down syndrome critical region protein 3 [Thecamonas trahens ATCC 50062]|eukprot:XP_013759373.1 down syndrome critical region protein 3 [Thecamonas trahens ATCC 50062]